MNTTYQTLIVKFSEPITALDGIFNDAQAWGTDTLKGWIDDYESTRFTATDSHTAVITSEYNMECVKEWLQRKYPLIPTLWMIFEDSTFAFRSGDKHRSRRIYGK